ncbi:NAD(P)H-quinone oxidoreductase subunit N [Pseudanabaena sp. FACHB-1998]|uniref:NAD(P)H-quinone oxidoreductase subunit N n=1 Tax=Pseudanabaena sp. FACHB-1998 TaxID=2692858 RepID=UPI001680A936|nr:NAD(P)H-quinone oxidoreductase subunit N [Pseudanabaena sp. FACHB-1998]MBD2177566.1 NAD(P)H-quinone oxidoreductase subunit N [Pseudanabaena sp. FACHB-1998]
MPLIATDKIVKDLEKAGALAMLVPPEGGYEGRYQLRLKNAGYEILFITARGLGDVNSYLTGVHGVRPSHLGKTEIRTYFIPPSIQFRLNALPAKSKGLVVWLIEGKYLSKEELETLSQIPDRDPRVKIVIETGSGREVTWQPLKQAVAA